MAVLESKPLPSGGVCKIEETSPGWYALKVGDRIVAQSQDFAYISRLYENQR